ncbi:dTDP-4-dehydrorhamnose reductase [Amycolatopsis xylanica]|uniref:dTDP-4-dehydrorhamnose reductase n=1 Tax=Amycolatopsis xylanica TaxID=589385 RepID=A0A1H3EXH8_9PSEU|nr:dTDP-4-dehydrorhamnose reductase [Amycolatopsis xylanica]SDX83217.1 dTDP-4-dehydrorhamnose reductase [Amycolatopsis xylanica]
MRIFLTGADGMLGTALTSALAAAPATAGWPVRGVSKADFDIADAEAVRREITAFEPDLVVHSAAHAIVDDCELDPGMAVRVNITGTANVARACKLVGARLVYISSDYVFDGSEVPAGGYREAEVPSPLSVYGLTKLAGERITGEVPGGLSVRTSWLFGGADPKLDHVLATVERIRRGEPVSLIADQVSCPTYTADLAAALVFVLRRAEPVTGTLNIVNTGIASWHEVGMRLMSLLEPSAASLRPVRMDGSGFVGARPANSALDNSLLAELGFTMPHWSDAVGRFVATLPAPAVEAAR